MNKVFARAALVTASLGLVFTSGIFKGVESKDSFVDPIKYEKPAVEVFRGDFQEKAEEAPVVSNVKKVIIHYYNSDKKSNTREIYTWTTGGDNKYTSLVQDDPTDLDFWHIELDLEGDAKAYAGKTFLNFIVKYAGTWDGQSIDTYLDYEEFTPDANGIIEVWTCPGEKGSIEIYKTKAETQFAKVNLAYFTTWKKIHCIADEKPTKYRLYAFDKTYLMTNELRQSRLKPSRLMKEGVPTSKEFDIEFNYVAHINVQYVLETEYESHTKTQSVIVTADRIYDDENFVRYYSSYKGNDLGCTWTPEKTTFKLWAPTAGAVVLNVYRKGTPRNILRSGSDASEQYVMTMQPQGVWEITLLTPTSKDNLDGKYYTYTIYNSEGISEVVDPYAKACGVNGKRGMILDFSRTNPDKWNELPLKWDGTERDIKTPQELSIYEVHIRDLTDDVTWTGKARHGSYPAFYEAKTKYNGLTTGFSHIEEMNVTAVQIMPTFDHDNAELRYYFKKDDQGQKTDEQVYVPANYDGEEELELEYNWGYNPLNYNCLEGSYSSDPEDGATRVREFKELVYAYANNKNKTRITMDVVYNHVSSVSKSNFTKIMPLYYFRFDYAHDVYWNGSGCSNEVKTEAPMMRKFIVDSLCWWASEYKVKGFRFDLMELIDLNTLNEARAALYKIDPDIYMYGEGWKAADYGLVGNGGGASTNNVYKNAKATEGSVHLGVFNNGGRDMLKGGNDGGSTGKSNFYWDGKDTAPVIEGNYTIYPLNIGGWSAAGAEVWVHAWKSETDNYHEKLTDPTKLKLKTGYNNFLLIRMAPNSEFAWDGDNFWGQSIDMSVGKGGVMFKDWGTIRTPGRDSFLTTKAGYSTPVAQMMTGYNPYEGVEQDPRQTVNYASCHDNFTLYDQLSWGLGHNPSNDSTAGAPDTADVVKAVMSAEQAVALSNGVAFVLGGDELLRTKVEDQPGKSREGEDFVKMYGVNISHNSYKSSEYTNSFKWDRKSSIRGYNGTAPNTAWIQIAYALGRRNELASFGQYSNSTIDGVCRYTEASNTQNGCSWYIGGLNVYFWNNTITYSWAQ